MEYMDVAQLFLHTVDDLRHKVESRSEYELFMTAALLRKLLLDERRLVDQVNREHRLKIRFRYNGPTPYDEHVLSLGPTVWTIGDGLECDPSMPSGLVNPIDGTRDQFLARSVLVVSGKHFDVAGVIGHVANVEGAVHKGKPKAEGQELLVELNQRLRFGGVPPLTQLLRSISNVTLDALDPLVKAASA